MNVKKTIEIEAVEDMLANIEGHIQHYWQNQKVDFTEIEERLQKGNYSAEEKEQYDKKITELKIRNEESKIKKDNMITSSAVIKNELIEKTAKIKKKETKSPFTNFLQLNKNLMVTLVTLNNINPNSLNILFFLMENMDNYNSIECPYDVINKVFGYSESTIKRAISPLKKLQYVKIKKDGNKNIYIVNKKLAWRSWGTNYDYCDFDSDIIISTVQNHKLLEKFSQSKVTKRSCLKI